MNAEQMRLRTKQFTLRVLRVVAALPDNAQGRVIAYQLMKSGTSVGANYRAVCRSRSRKDFINKLGVVIEEADESAYWLEVICEGQVLDPRLIGPLLTEANELIAIFTTARKTARSHCPQPKPKG
ncbi:MAG: four helix bundle protein [Planctomycetaceae bacterium]|nr:four helix bundle protein [Planctomycetaceae bacterium]